MIRPAVWELVAIPAALAAFGGLTLGCTEDRACIQLGGRFASCPSRAEAEATFLCGGTDVFSVNSEPELEDNLCCYDVEKSTSISSNICTGTGTGTATGTGRGCDGCSIAVTTGDPTNICNESIGLYDGLAQCLCLDSCADLCSDNSCAGVPADAACTDCATALCATALDRCLAD